jgi:hypothetical protein
MRVPVILSATALVVAVLGSTPVGEAAYRAIIPPNSVGTAQLKADAVISSKVKNGSLVKADFKAGETPMWAIVGSDGALVAANGATKAVLLDPPAYEISFVRDISRCAVEATRAGGGTGPTDFFSISVGPSPAGANVLRVSVLGFDPNQRNFALIRAHVHVTVVC